MRAGYAHPEALVTVDWLAEHLDDAGVRILDGSFHLPGSGRDPRVSPRICGIPLAEVTKRLRLRRTGSQTRAARPQEVPGCARSRFDGRGRISSTADSALNDSIAFPGGLSRMM